jgi:hypothetical protein
MVCTKGCANREITMPLSPNACPKFLLTNSFRLSTTYTPGLTLALDAFELAEEEQRPVWDFAIPIQDLHQMGLTDHHLRRLLWHEILLLAEEISRPGSQSRKFMLMPSNTTCFSKKSCFALNINNAEQVRDFVWTEVDHEQELSGTMAPRGPVPFWDGKVLRFLDLVIKEFRQPAWAQKCLLDAFQKPNWAPLVRNPFVGEPYKALSRLENAVKKLNLGHVHEGLLKFQLARGGDAAGWENIAHRMRNPSGTQAAFDKT